MSQYSPHRTLSTCCVTHGLHDGLSDVNYVLLPILAQAFHLSLVQVGMIRSVWYAAMSLFEFPAGVLGERFSARILLSVGTACSGIAFIVLGYAAGFATILLTLFCAGFGSAFQHPLCSTLVSNAYPAEGRRAALGTYNFSGDMGKFALSGAASLLFVAGVPWQAPITVFGVLSLACALAILLLLPKRHTHGQLPATISVSVLYATIGDLVEQDRHSRVFGLFYTIGSVCSLIVPLLFGAVGDVIGITATIALIGTLVFLTLPLCRILKTALTSLRAVT